MEVDNRTGAHPNQVNGETENYDFLFKPQIDLNDPTNEDGDVEHQGFYVYLYVDFDQAAHANAWAQPYR